MNRRRVLKVGGSVLGLAGLGAGYAGYRLLPPSPNAEIRDPFTLAAEFLDTLDTSQRERVLLDYDHPLRQYHNRGVWAHGEQATMTIASEGLSWKQRSLLVDLMYSGLSPVGREMIPNQFFLRVADVMANNLHICGEPRSDHCQIFFTGPHLNLRIGGANREGVAFGGPQVYGDQTGNEVPEIPGNQYRPQYLVAKALYQLFSPEQKKAARLPNSPIQTQIEVQGRTGDFDGIPVAEMTRDQQSRVNELIDLAFAPYPEADVAYAWECINANGGVSSLYASYYEDSRYDESDGDGGYQNFRLEGPAAVFYIQGIPHVHGFLNVAMDGESPLSVGKVLGHNPSMIEGEELTRVFEKIMMSSTGADIALYEGAVGQLRPGMIRTGDVYNAESWQNDVLTLEIKGHSMSDELIQRLRLRGESVNAEKVYRVAATNFNVDERPETLGDFGIVGENGMLRGMVLDHFDQNGFS